MFNQPWQQQEPRLPRLAVSPQPPRSGPSSPWPRAIAGSEGAEQGCDYGMGCTVLHPLLWVRRWGRGGEVTPTCAHKHTLMETSAVTSTPALRRPGRASAMKRR